jgi:hypothetical protein
VRFIALHLYVGIAINRQGDSLQSIADLPPVSRQTAQKLNLTPDI